MHTKVKNSKKRRCDHGVGREISAGHVHVALRGVDVGEAERAGALGAVST